MIIPRSMRLRPLPPLLLFLLLFLGAAALVAAPSAAIGQPITIGLSLSLNGQFADIAQDLEKGYRLWETEVNQRGGVLGRPVVVKIHDDGSSPEAARAIYGRLIAEKQVDFLFGPYSSLISHAVLPIAAAAGRPILMGGAAADSLWEQGHNNVIGIYTPASKFTLGFFELLVWRGLDRIAILAAEDPFSRDLELSARRWAERFGLQVLLSDRFPKGRVDLAPLAEKARRAGAQVVVMCGHLDEAVNFRRALKTLAWEPAAYYASVGPALPTFLARCGADAEGVFATSMWEPNANFPGARSFLEAYTARHGAMPGYHAALAYATGQVLEAAIAQAGTTEPGAVRDTLFAMDRMTIIGRFGVDHDGKQVRQHTFIIQWQAGRKEIVWPREIQTSPPRFR
jgi:branched-chain amino acid transport system substrate-binding protein